MKVKRGYTYIFNYFEILRITPVANGPLLFLGAKRNLQATRIQDISVISEKAEALI